MPHLLRTLFHRRWKRYLAGSWNSSLICLKKGCTFRLRSNLCRCKGAAISASNLIVRALSVITSLYKIQQPTMKKNTRHEQQTFETVTHAGSSLYRIPLNSILWTAFGARVKLSRGTTLYSMYRSEANAWNRSVDRPVVKEANTLSGVRTNLMWLWDYLTFHLNTLNDSDGTCYTDDRIFFYAIRTWRVAK